MEKIRETIVLIKNAIGEYDDLTDKMADARFKLEQLRRNPDLGRKMVRGPDGNPKMQTVISPEMLKDNIEALAEERELAEEVLMYLTGREESISMIRSRFTALLLAFNRVGTLDEQAEGIAQGMHPDELGLKENQVLNRAQAKENLERIAKVFSVPPISELEIPSPVTLIT